jgi:hypothetical protein
MSPPIPSNGEHKEDTRTSVLETRVDYLEDDLREIREQVAILPGISVTVEAIHSEVIKCSGAIEKHLEDHKATEVRQAQEHSSQSTKVNIVYWIVITLITGAVIGKIVLPLIGL